VGDDLNNDDNVTECQPSILVHVKITSTFIGSALMALPANSEEIFILLLINLLTSLCRRLPKSLNIVDPPDKTKYIIQASRERLGFYLGTYQCFHRVGALYQLGNLRLRHQQLRLLM